MKSKFLFVLLTGEYRDIQKAYMGVSENRGPSYSTLK